MPIPANDTYSQISATADITTQLVLSIVREDIHQILMSELRAADTAKEIETVVRIRERIETALRGRVR